MYHARTLHESNRLKIDNHKKVMVLSFNFLELGKANLSMTSTWMVPAVVRHTMLVQVRGGWPCMLKKYVHRQLLGSQCGLQTSGAVVYLQGSPLVIFARLTNLFSDGDGLRDALDWRGANSWKPSFRHSKILKLGSDIVQPDDPEYVEIDCDDPSRIKGWSNEEFECVVDLILEARERYVAGNMYKKTFEALCKVHGLNYNADGLIFDRSLRAVLKPVVTVTVDWMHTFLQGGILTVEIHLLLVHVGVPYATMEAYLQTRWYFPRVTRQKSNELHRVFNDFRRRSSEKADKLKASCSELLGLYHMIRHYVETKVASDRCPASQASFFACCKCIDIINQARHGHITTAEAAPVLRAATQQFLIKHKRAYGTSELIPKHAWMWDVVAQLERDPVVLDMFVVERGHLGVKFVADRVDNLRCYERSVLSGVVTDRLNKLGEQPYELDHLDGTRASSSEYPMATFSKRLTLTRGLDLEVGDVVIREDDHELGRIAACAQEKATLMIIVERAALLRHRSRNSSIFEFTGELAIWAPTVVRAAPAWYNYQDRESCVVVLMP